MNDEEKGNETKNSYGIQEMIDDLKEAEPINEYIVEMYKLRHEVIHLRDENAKLKAENAELKEKDIHCANSMDDMIKRCDSCGLFECVGCEHSHAAVMEVKKLKEDYESLKGRLSNENV